MKTVTDKKKNTV